MFNVDVVSKDSATGLLYVKVAQPGSAVWRPIEFAQDPKINDEVFVATNNWWQAVFLENIGYALFPEGHSDTILPIRWLISSARQSGSPVVSKQGGLVGITTEEGVLPAAVIEQQLSSVLARHVLSYASLGIEGWYSDEQSFFINSKFTPGFLVTKVTTKNSLLQKGDSIIAYNGRVVEPEKMWYTIQTTHSLNLTIMRDGKELQLTVVPTLVKN
jgi:S1-C subfamily serine protease